VIFYLLGRTTRGQIVAMPFESGEPPFEDGIVGAAR
jgi:hypothetical protein